MAHNHEDTGSKPVSGIIPIRLLYRRSPSQLSDVKTQHHTTNTGVAQRERGDRTQGKNLHVISQQLHHTNTFFYLYERIWEIIVACCNLIQCLKKARSSKFYPPHPLPHHPPDGRDEKPCDEKPCDDEKHTCVFCKPFDFLLVILLTNKKK